MGLLFFKLVWAARATDLCGIKIVKSRALIGVTLTGTEYLELDDIFEMLLLQVLCVEGQVLNSGMGCETPYTNLHWQGLVLYSKILWIKRMEMSTIRHIRLVHNCSLSMSKVLILQQMGSTFIKCQLLPLIRIFHLLMSDDKMPQLNRNLV